jgi:microcystin-dependent protein
MFGSSGVTIDASILPPPAASADSVKPGTMAPFAGAAAPMGWLLCFGQAVSRSAFPDLFTAIGTTYGVGDGSTTFGLPDMRGRVPGGKDDMGGAAAGRLSVTLTGTKASTANGSITGLSSTAGLAIGMRAFGTGIGTNAVISAITSGTAVTLSVNSTSTGAGTIRFAVVDGATLGAVGGDHVHQLATAQIPAHTHTQTAAAILSGSQYANVGDGQLGSAGETSSTGGGQAHPNVQPTMVLNYIIKT